MAAGIGITMADCPAEAFPLEFLLRGIVMSVVWVLLPLVLDAVHSFIWIITETVRRKT